MLIFEFILSCTIACRNYLARTARVLEIIELSTQVIFVFKLFSGDDEEMKNLAQAEIEEVEASLQHLQDVVGCLLCFLLSLHYVIMCLCSSLEALSQCSSHYVKLVIA